MPALTNLAYAEFDTTQANLLADLRTNILASASWARPNSASKPDTYKATTTRGADMVFDLSDAAISTFAMTIGVWRSYDGTTFTDKTQRYLYWRASAGASTNALHCIVSASKEHIYISVEGPRAPETGAESASLGSARQSFFMCDLVPYHAGDTTPVVFAGGNPTASLTSNNVVNVTGNLSRNYGATAAWDPTRLVTLGVPGIGSSFGVNFQRQTLDTNYYLSPYVAASDSNGVRGRLATFFHAGMNNPDIVYTDVPSPPIGARVTYDGQTYKLLNTTRTGTNVSNYNQFGYTLNNSGSANAQIVAIPST